IRKRENKHHEKIPATAVFGRAISPAEKRDRKKELCRLLGVCGIQKFTEQRCGVAILTFSLTAKHQRILCIRYPAGGESAEYHCLATRRSADENICRAGAFCGVVGPARRKGDRASVYRYDRCANRGRPAASADDLERGNKDQCDDKIMNHFFFKILPIAFFLGCASLFVSGEAHAAVTLQPASGPWTGMETGQTTYPDLQFFSPTPPISYTATYNYGCEQATGGVLACHKKWPTEDVNDKYDCGNSIITPSNLVDLGSAWLFN